MSTPMLMVFLGLVAFSQIGCGKSKKEKLKEHETKAAINACMFDPTGQCQKRAQLMMENPATQQHIAAAVSNGGTGIVQKSPATGQIIPVLPQSIQQQAAKIQKELAADASNPRSLHYDPAQPSRAPASSPQVATSGVGRAIAPASVPEMPPTASSGGGGGDIMR